MQRRCWSCRSLDMRPTEKMRKPLRIYKCADCGTEFPWADDPHINDAYAEKHQVIPGQFDVVSMMSDPDCDVFTRDQQQEFHQSKCAETPRPRRTKVPRDEATLARSGIKFVTDDQGRKTHRWHNGRQEWVKL